MSSDQISIPEVYHPAASIFLEELRAHLTHFESFDITLQSNLAAPYRGASTDLKMLAERFHLIKGGAGFLNLSSLRDAGDAGEKYFRMPACAKAPAADLHAELQRHLPCIRSSVEALEKTLLPAM